MPENKLTIETLEEVVKYLERIRKKAEQETEIFSLGEFNFKFIKSDILKDTQVIIKSGDKVYYSPDIKAGEVKVIDIPDFSDSLPPFKPDL